MEQVVPTEGGVREVVNRCVWQGSCGRSAAGCQGTGRTCLCRAEREQASGAGGGSQPRDRHCSVYMTFRAVLDRLLQN